MIWKDTIVFGKSPSQQSMSEQKQAMESKKLLQIELVNTQTFIINKWKELITTKSLPRAGHPIKLSEWREGVLVKEMMKNPKVILMALQKSFVEMGCPAQMIT